MLAAFFTLAFPAVGCGTLARPGGGADNLPTRGAGPFAPLAPLDPNYPGDEPFVLADPTADLGDPDARFDPRGTGFVVYLSRTAADGTTDIRRSHIADPHRGGTLPEPVLAPAADWEAARVSAPSVVHRGGEVLLYYQGGDGAIGLARSRDGRAFVRQAAPVLRADLPVEGSSLRAPAALVLGQRVVLFYAAASSIFAADSEDGVHFRKWPNPPLLAPEHGSFDSSSVGDPSLRGGPGPAGYPVFDLFYGGQSDRGKRGIGFAGSFDLAQWTRSPQNPVLARGSGEEQAPCALSDGVRAYLFYARPRDGRLAVAMAEQVRR